MKGIIITEEQINLLENKFEMQEYLQQIYNLFMSADKDNVKTAFEILKGMEPEIKAVMGKSFSVRKFLKEIFYNLSERCSFFIDFSVEMEELEGDILDMLSVRSIYITGSKITNSEVPAEIKGFFNLRGVYMGNNHLDYIPEELFDKPSLEVLSIHSNLIADVPEKILQLHNLHTLDISYNGLRALPPVLKKMNNLHSLYIQGNFIPRGDLEELESILTNCQIKY